MTGIETILQIKKVASEPSTDFVNKARPHTLIKYIFLPFHFLGGHSFEAEEQQKGKKLK